MLRYYVMLSDTNRITHCKTTLRWLLRRGSPLPIPNRVVKPACADGTAVMWESMSSPFFKNPSSIDEGFFLLLLLMIFLGTLAQMVEQWTENPCVPGSIPGGTTKCSDGEIGRHAGLKIQ